MNKWPHQSSLNNYYGNPRGANGVASAKWMKSNLVFISVPWQAVAAWAVMSPVKRILIHKRCAESLKRILAKIWNLAGRVQAKIVEWGMHLFGGAYMFRMMRGSTNLSTHSWGCAVDWDPANNGLGDFTPKLIPGHPVVEAFKSEGWTWGGDWNGNNRIADERRPDAMHFQAATV